MTIPINTMRRIIREVTDVPIENKALYYLLSKVEVDIKEIALLALNLHNARNKLRIANGQRVKKRLSEEIFKEVVHNNDKNQS